MLTYEIIAICQPTFREVLIAWTDLSLHTESIPPQNEEQWLKRKAYCIKNYPSVIQKYNLS
jgi:hypothetical protein